MWTFSALHDLASFNIPFPAKNCIHCIDVQGSHDRVYKCPYMPGQEFCLGNGLMYGHCMGNSAIHFPGMCHACPYIPTHCQYTFHTLSKQETGFLGLSVELKSPPRCTVHHSAQLHWETRCVMFKGIEMKLNE